MLNFIIKERNFHKNQNVLVDRLRKCEKGKSDTKQRNDHRH